jgi:hypothetical protein
MVRGELSQTHRLGVAFALPAILLHPRGLGGEKLEDFLTNSTVFVKELACR